MRDMKQRAARRPKASPEEAKQWVEAFRRSGLSRKDFARKHGINVWTLRNWQRRVSKKDSPQAKDGPSSLVELENPLSKQGKDSRRFSYRIEMIDGTVLELPSGFAKEEVQDLVAILGRKQ